MSAVRAAPDGDDGCRCGEGAGWVPADLSCGCPTTPSLPPARYGVRP